MSLKIGSMYTDSDQHQRKHKVAQPQGRQKEQSPSHCEEMAGEWKFDGHVLPSPPCKCTEAYKPPDPLFTRYRQKKEQRLLYQKPCLTRQNVWVMPFMTPQILRGFLHMYTLNSCHFFLYLLWIFKKCYQSTCFTVLFTVFLYFTEGLRSLDSPWSSLGGLRPVCADSGDVGYLYSV